MEQHVEQEMELDQEMELLEVKNKEINYLIRLLDLKFEV